MKGLLTLMSAVTSIKSNALVLYKSYPARVVKVDVKIEIELSDGKILSVRDKDVILLHPGPLTSLSKLMDVPGEIEAACEVLAGEIVTLKDLSELIYGSYSPESVWAVYKLFQENLYFTGSLDAIQVRTKEEYEKEKAMRLSKKTEALAWQAFLGRVKAGHLVDEDVLRLRDLTDFACKKSSSSRILKELGLSESIEQAHALLLKLGIWDSTFNPYVLRNGFSWDVIYPPLGELGVGPRKDLTYLEAFAIDDEGNTDPDDAISIEGDMLWIHVADVAVLVVPDSPMDLLAKKLAANLYLPEKTIHMLPPKVTEILGLGLQETSPALSFGVTLDSSGAIEKVEIVISTVKVTRLTYTQAQALLGQSPLSGILAMTKRYRQNRVIHQASQIAFPEVKIKVVDKKVDIKLLPELDSKDLVTDAMIMAGEAAARFAIDNKILFPYVTQSPPENYEIPTDLAGMFAYRRKLRPSEVKLSPDVHSGMGLLHYGRVTSPLRRYLDLIAHQQLRAFLLNQPMLSEQELMNRIGVSAATVGLIATCERQSNRHFTLVYLMQNPNWRGKGIVVEIRERYCIVLIPTLAFEARVTSSRHVSLNEELDLKVNGVDLAEGIAHFRIV